MKTSFIDKGYAVILGEYAAMARLSVAEHAGYRKYYLEYITKSAVDHGLVPFYWDSGFTGDKGSGLFNRSTGAKVYPDIVTAMTGK
jgi:endoglucanase